MSLLLDYNRSIDSISGLDFGTRNGTINLRQPIYLDPNKKKQFRVLRVMLSPEIPNVYNSGGINTTTCNISRDGGATWITCLLKKGIYTISMLNDSINDVATLQSWWAVKGEYGFDLSYNPATKIVYIKLDSTKLAVGGTQLAIDFGVSQMGLMCGFSSTNNSFIVDGLHTADLSPQLDWQGQYVEIFCSIIQSTRWVNGQLSSALCRVPISASTSEIVFPSANNGMISPLINASIPSAIQSFDVTIKNAFGRDAVFLYGNASIELEIIDV